MTSTGLVSIATIKNVSYIATFLATAEYLGFRPRAVRVWAAKDDGSVTTHSFGSWTEGVNNGSVVSGDDNASGETVTSSGSLWTTSRLAGGANGSTGVVSSVTNSGFTFDVSWVASTTFIYWEAEE